jgi:hypothetical protein
LPHGIRAQDENLLVNGGFEDDTAGWLAIDGELTTSDAFTRSGSYAGVFTSVSPGGQVSRCLPVTPSADYGFQGYAARRGGDIASSIHLSVAWYPQDDCLDQGLGRPYDSPMVPLEKHENWYELALDARSPSTARAARLRIVVQEGGATVYLDDFAVSGPAAPTATPTPEPSPSPSPSASPSPTPTATAEQRTPSPSATSRASPSATPRGSPPASSRERTPVPVSSALRNGGFEEGTSEGLPSSWQKYGGELVRTSAGHFEGQFAAAFTSKTSSTKWAYQTVTVQGERAYVLSAYALKDDPGVAAAYLRLSWYASPDGSGQAIDSVDSTERLKDDSSEFRLLTTGPVVAPAEAASAKARLMLDPASEAPGTVHFDAVTFEETAFPKPTVSPTGQPPPPDGEETPTPASPIVGKTPFASASDGRTATPSPGSATSPRSSPTAAGVAGNRTPAALGATRTPVATATATPATSPTATQATAALYRQRKTDSLVRDVEAVREGESGGGLSSELLALAAVVPTLSVAGAGVYYRRWRRGRLR